MTVRALLLILAAAAPTTAFAAPPTAATPAVAAQPVDRLLDVLFQSGNALDLGRQQILATLEQQIKSDQNIQAAERKRPGLIAAMLQSMDRELGLAMSGAFVELRAEFRKVLSVKLTDAEMQDVIAFYSTPLGRRMLAEASNSAVTKGVELGTAAGAKGEVGVTEAQMQTLTNVGTAAALKTIEAGDVEALTVFGQTSAASKLAALGPDLNNASMTVINRMSETAMPRVATALEATIQKHMTGARRR